MDLSEAEEKEILRRIYVGRQENQRIGGVLAYLEFEISEIENDLKNAKRDIAKKFYYNQLLKIKNVLRILKNRND